MDQFSVSELDLTEWVFDNLSTNTQLQDVTEATDLGASARDTSDICPPAMDAQRFVTGDDPVMTTAGLEEVPFLEDSTLHPFAGILPEAGQNDDGRSNMDYPIAIHTNGVPTKSQTFLEGDEIHYPDSDEEEEKPSPLTRLKWVQRDASQNSAQLGAHQSTDGATDLKVGTKVPKGMKTGENVPESAVQPQRKSPRQSQAVTRSKVKRTNENEGDEGRFSNGKRKLYKSRPFANDPEKERSRRNAVNAKRNREQKKRERARMEEEMTELRAENTTLKREKESLQERLARMEERMAYMEEEMREWRAENTTLREMLRANNIKILDVEE